MSEKDNLISENALNDNVQKGLAFRSFFTRPGEDPLDVVQWDARSAVIRNSEGNVVFEQTDIETPVFWSDMAVNVVASRYFRGRPGSPERETSIRGLLTRVVDTISGWGEEQGYFASIDDAAVFRNELTHLLVHQMASFNSPVWFNVGVEQTPQCSACFIVSVEDTMESILAWYSQEGMIFKGGSGSGTNISGLRSSQELLSGGGTASGPVSFMKAADASAGVIKSGGKTRRAAKMVILNVDHPDIVQFIRAKAVEEKKARILIEAGYDGSFEGEVYSTVAFQNTNHSVRVPDSFMKAVEADGEWQTRFVLSGEPAETFKARELFREIAEAAHVCGDPGLQFDTIINNYHTCPETAPIRASNPCSEYLHVDDSACNLASLRLTAFLDENGDFDEEAFLYAVDILITAQDIIVDKASYPTDKIKRNSRNMRALGLGYADLGAMIMRMGLPYDSPEARSWAGVITSLMTGEAYLQSARIAEKRGAFNEFEKNREAMMKVLKMQMDESLKIQTPSVKQLSFIAGRIWEDALSAGEAHGYANCQVSVLAPTGTVSFMMDCDTTGVEPELALVKFKRLSGGGRLKIVNGAVGTALERLGYNAEEIETIVAQIGRTGSAEGIPELKEEHLSVFDCAFRPVTGKRSISTVGHLKMMAAVQPFLSGAISKTVNLPNDTTVEQIEDIFLMAWRLGLKSLAVYRDGCKAVQPLTGLVKEKASFGQPVRRRLPVDCRSERHKFEIGGQKGYIHTGFYDDGKIGEIFIRMNKEGSTISGLMDTIATLTSIALQYGVPLEALVNKFSHVRFEPSGFTQNPDIPIAKSLTDYIFRYLGIRFLEKEQQIAAGLLPRTEEVDSGTELPSNRDPDIQHAFNPQSDAPPCRYCGLIMVRNGSCYKCLNCGETSGCS